MMFAQSESISPSPSAPQLNNGLLNDNTWWLLGGGVAILLVIVFLSRRRQAGMREVANKKLEKTPIIANLAAETDNQVFGRQRTSGKKSKVKKSKKVSQGKGPPRIETAVSKADDQNKLEPTPPAIVPESLKVVETVQAESAPVISIFEPLQQVGSFRRVSVPEMEKSRRASNEEEEIETSRAPIVPFEKMKKVSARVPSSANRWASLNAEKGNQVEPVQEKVVEKSETTELKSHSQPVSSPPLPASEPLPRSPQGLKGFVSKVRSSGSASGS
jgi:hypothetical protein